MQLITTREIITAYEFNDAEAALIREYAAAHNVGLVYAANQLHAQGTICIYEDDYTIVDEYVNNVYIEEGI